MFSSQKNQIAGAVLAVSGLAGATFSLNGCRSTDFKALELSIQSVENLPSPTTEALTVLSRIEDRLQKLELTRQAAVGIYGFMLIIEEVRDGYNQAIDRHKKIAAEVADRKLRLIALTGPELEEASKDSLTWATEMDEALDNVMRLIISVQNNKCIPDDWTAPSQFPELIRLQKTPTVEKAQTITPPDETQSSPPTPPTPSRG